MISKFQLTLFLGYRLELHLFISLVPNVYWKIEVAIQIEWELSAAEDKSCDLLDVLQSH